jgi:hypothetical protein
LKECFVIVGKQLSYLDFGSWHMIAIWTLVISHRYRWAMISSHKDGNMGLSASGAPF